VYLGGPSQIAQGRAALRSLAQPADGKRPRSHAAKDGPGLAASGRAF